MRYGYKASAEQFSPAELLELVQLGWLGTTEPGGTAGDLLGTTRAALVPLAVAAAWGVLGVLAARPLFRWEPRG